MVRIFAIISILTGIGGFVVSHLKVQKIIDDTRADLAQTQSTLASEQSAHDNTRQILSSTLGVLNTTSNRLVQTEMDLAAKTQEAQQAQQQRAAALAAQKKAEQAEAHAKSENKAFWDFGKEMADVKRVYQLLPKTTKERDAFSAENKILTTKVTDLNNKIARMRDPSKPPPMPEGLQGAITAFDPRFQYVVVNIGNSHGVVQNGEMMINRDGELVGKIKITRVEDNYSIANVMQDWKKTEPVEGDQVVYKDL